MQCMISDETPFAHNGCSQILQYMPMVKSAAVDRRPVRSKYGETGPLERNRRSSILVAHDLFRKPVSTFRDHALFDQAAEDEAGIGAAKAE